MTTDFHGWECKRAADCGGFVQDEIIDATAAQWRKIRDEQQAHLETHEAQGRA